MDNNSNTCMKAVEDGVEKQNKTFTLKTKIHKWLGVEIMMALYFMVLPPSIALTQQFIYSEIADEKNYTISDDSQGYCGPDGENLTIQDELQARQFTS